MRLQNYLIEKAKVNYAVTPDSELGIYIQTIGVPDNEQHRGVATKAILDIIKKHPKSKKITFSSPLSTGGSALTKSLLRKGILKLETPPKSWMKPSINIFMIAR